MVAFLHLLKTQVQVHIFLLNKYRHCIADMSKRAIMLALVLSTWYII